MAAALARVPIFQDRFWCGLWLLATVILPGAVGFFFLFLLLSEILPLIAMAILLLHFVASSRVDCGRSDWTMALLLVGGWFLILVSLIVGCFISSCILFGGDTVGGVLFLPG